MKRLQRISLLVGVLLTFAVVTVSAGSVNDVGTYTPSLEPQIPLEQNGEGLQVRGNLVFSSTSLPDHPHSIIIYDITDPLAPQQLAVIPRPEGGAGWREFDVQGDFLYAFALYQDWDFRGRVYIFDVSNPKVPVELTHIKGPGLFGFGFPQLIRASEDNRYLHLTETSTDWPLPVQVYDITDLENPQLVAGYSYECGALDLTLVGQRAYVKLDTCPDEPPLTRTMAIFDISDPTEPNLVSDDTLKTLTSNAIGFDVWQEKLYVETVDDLLGGEYSCELRAIDVANPAEPILLGMDDLGSASGCGGWGLRVWNDTLYYPTSSDLKWMEMQLYDVRYPVDISLTSRYRLPVQGNGFHPFDVKDTCVYWDTYDYSHGLFGMCTGGVVAVIPTASPTATHSPTFTPQPTATYTPSATATSQPTFTPTATFTQTPTITPSSTPSHTPTATLTASPTATHTSTPTLTPSLTPSLTSIATATPPANYLPLIRIW